MSQIIAGDNNNNNVKENAKDQQRSTIFCRMLIREKVKILPKEIGSNIRAVIMSKLQSSLEGLCSRHGYVRPGSVKIHELSPGRIEGASLNGDVIYNVNVIADVCNPCPGHVLPARVVNSNKFGLLAQSGIEVDGKFSTIIQTVIIRNNSPTEVPLDSVRVGDDVFVEVLGKKFELKETMIRVMGRLLRAVPTTNNKRGGLLPINVMPTLIDTDDATGVTAVEEEEDDDVNDDIPDDVSDNTVVDDSINDDVEDEEKEISDDEEGVDDRSDDVQEEDDVDVELDDDLVDDDLDGDPIDGDDQDGGADDDIDADTLEYDDISTK